MKRMVLLALFSVSCAKDPVYIAPNPAAVEVGGPMGATTGTISVLVPIATPTDKDYEDHTALAELLMVGWDQVPDVLRDELYLEIEWTVKNLDDTPGTFTVSVLGANEWYSYDPNAFVIDPLEDPVPPPLL